MQQRLETLLVTPIAFAHRGAKAHAPENTLQAFELALKLGANGLESDVWLTADGVPVLDHDGVFKVRRTQRRVDETPRSHLPGYIPELLDVYALCGTGFQFSLDVKGPDTGKVVVESVAASYPDAIGRLWLCDPVWERLAPLRPLSADVKLVDSTRLARIKEGVERRAATLREAGIDALNMHHTDWTGGLVTLVHRFGRAALSWDLQHERLLDDAYRMGCDGVFSDWVDRMVDSYARVHGANPQMF